MPKTPARLLALAALLSLPALAGPPSVYPESAMTKVFPSAVSKGPGPVDLLAGRNEFVSFQVVVHGGDSGVRGVRAFPPELLGPARIAAPDVTLYRVALIHLTRQSGGVGELGPWPDGLVPDVDEIAGERRGAFPFDVPPNESRAIWVDVRVPEDAAPGQYEGSVLIEAEALAREVPVTLEVVHESLPSTPTLEAAFMAWPPHVCNAHTGLPDCGGQERSAELLARYHQMALEHRVSLANAFQVPQPTSGDWSAFDRVYAPLLDGESPGRLSGAKMTSVQFLGAEEGPALRAFEEHFAQKGWLDRAYHYTGDEPPYGISFEDARTAARLVNDSAPALTTLLTTSVQQAEKEGLAGPIDRLTVLVNQMDGTEAPYQGSQRAYYDTWLEQPDKSLWLYQSCMSHGCSYGTNMPENRGAEGWPSYMIDRSAAKNRAMQTLVFLEDASGELYYQTVGMLGTAWTDQFRYNGNGDGTLFYPGRPSDIGGSTDVPVASIRLKMVRAGVQDYEWLRKVADAGDPELARRLARELIPAASRVGDDGEAFERMRTTLIRRLAELRPPGDPGPGEPPAEEPPGGEPGDEEPPGGEPGDGEPPTGEEPPGDASPPDEATGMGCQSAGTGAATSLGLLLLAALVPLARRRSAVRVPSHAGPRGR